MFSNKRARKSGDIACIFVHAGAGYHSTQNEKIHLQACNDASKAAMAVLRNGGSAVDAVEIAVKILEDREITNAGYGSNLAMDGVVECDAVVVDHFGRSGAAGAVAQIKNPVSLARLLLDHTTRTLSLRRVPPNLVVGQGATEFAYEHGMPVLPLDALVSPAARDRWRRWRDDLDRAERDRDSVRHGISPVTSQIDVEENYDFLDEHEQMRRVHTKAMRNGTWNEAQPISPPPSDDRAEAINDSSSPSRRASSIYLTGDTADTAPELAEYMDPHGPPSLKNASENPFSNSTQQILNPSASGFFGSQSSSDGGIMTPRWCNSVTNLSDSSEMQDVVPTHTNVVSEEARPENDSSRAHSDGTTIGLHLASPGQSSDHISKECHRDEPASTLPSAVSSANSWSQTEGGCLSDRMDENLSASSRPEYFDFGKTPKEDKITDTVGAIAIDTYGNIACGASSGGIGMKHRGRIGPAALVGIGAAVIPPDPDDSERTTVATVTSGTGEHMATTMAAGVCSDRVYQNLRKMPGGCYETCGDDEAIKGFIEKDFMSHPSVKQSHSSGAIGILSIKRTRDGAYLYFGHNTDSLALASMHSDETKPVCTMSRSKGGGVIAQGGRAIRYRKRKAY